MTMPEAAPVDTQHNLMGWLRDRAAWPVFALAGAVGVAGCGGSGEDTASHQTPIVAQAGATPGPNPPTTEITNSPSRNFKSAIDETAHAVLGTDIQPEYPSKWPPGVDQEGMPAGAYYRLPKDGAWELCNVGTDEKSIGLLATILKKSESFLKKNSSCIGQAALSGGTVDPEGKIEGTSLYTYDVSPFNWFDVKTLPKQGRWLTTRLESGATTNMVSKLAFPEKFTINGISGYIGQIKFTETFMRFHPLVATVDCRGINGAAEHGIADEATVTVTVKDLLTNQIEGTGPGQVSPEQILTAAEDPTPKELSALKQYAANMCLALQGSAS